MSKSKNILDELKEASPNSIITLKDGTEIKVSDILSVKEENGNSAFFHAYNKVMRCENKAMSLEKFLDFIKLTSDKILSSAFDEEDTSHMSGAVIISNSQWIYRELMFKEPIHFTVVKAGDFYHIVDPFVKIRALMNFIYNERPLSDIFNLSENKEIYWNDLDYNTKEGLLSMPVNIHFVNGKQSDYDLDYLNLAVSLYNVPQSIKRNSYRA